MQEKLFLGILFIVFMNAISAQVEVGVTSGLNLSNNSGETSINNSKAGFQAGIVADYSFNDKFSLLPEFIFTQLGSKGSKSYLRLNYLQMPVNFAYKFNVGNFSKLLVFAGLYIGYGLTAKLKTESGDFLDVKFGSTENAYKPFDFGWNAGVGYQYEKLFLRFKYSRGLYNISHIKDSSLKNINLAISAGYYF